MLTSKRERPPPPPKKKTNSSQAVGPVAVTSMIIGSSLPAIVARDSPGFRFQSDPNKPSDVRGQDAYNRAAIQVAFLAGVFYTLVGVLRLGFFTNFLSHSVISGFMTGAATLIGLHANDGIVRLDGGAGGGGEGRGDVTVVDVSCLAVRVAF